MTKEEAARQYADLGIDSLWSWSHDTALQRNAPVFADVPQGNLQFDAEDICDDISAAHDDPHAAVLQQPGHGSCRDEHRRGVSNGCG